MDQRIIRILAWASIVVIFIVTDGPISLRPSLGLGANAERLLAFAVVGILFALAYPNRLTMILVLLVGAAALFEVLQIQAFSRHGHLKDFAYKVSGASIGILGGLAVNHWRRAYEALRER